MSAHQTTRTYRGATLEELLPQIVDELGEQAVITRQRDGVIGGVGGFFGKRCVEVDAQPGHIAAAPQPPAEPDDSPPRIGSSAPHARSPLSTSTAGAAAAPPQSAADAPASPRATPSLAAHSIVDLYDDGGPRESNGWDGWPTMSAAAPAPAPARATATAPAPAAVAPSAPDRPGSRPVEGEFVETLFEQSVPFASHLAQAEASGPAAPSMQHTAAPTPTVIAPPPPISPEHISEQVNARVSMSESGLPALLADNLLREVATHVEPLDATVPLVEHLRRALANEIRVRRGWWGPRRMVALIGEEGAGKTLTAARLCRAYASRTMLSVSALSLEPARVALELARLTDGAEINFAMAETPAEVRTARRKLEREELVIADTPAFDPADAQSLTRLGCMLDALEPDETHLLVPASSDERAAKRLIESVAECSDCLVISHADQAPGPPGAVVGLGITMGMPFSYLSHGHGLDASLEAADPTTLARMVLP